MDHHGWINLKEHTPAPEDGEYVLVWHVYQGTMAIRREECTKNRFYSHWKPIPTEGWIDKNEHMPTVEDGDVWRCVLTRHEIYGFKVTGWQQLEHDRYYTHWMRTPEPPDDFVELRNIL
ncbi:MAG: hypothetical protein II967_04970 [Deltaproteobacteria bacterium]|nr:hypothetical protein [Deltaproteobacteria bacterium]